MIIDRTRKEKRKGRTISPEVVFVKSMNIGDVFLKKHYDTELNKWRDNIYKYQQRTGRFFSIVKTWDGLRVERIK